ncbi:MAG: flippase-like domain-containing protein [Deltaproteobacteria bacterium]|nr:flippase-like domain-containing protein [Deltaproteobacteria bacterium]
MSGLRLLASKKSPWTIAWRFSFVVVVLAALIWYVDHIGWDVVRDHAAKPGWATALVLFLLGVAEAAVDSVALQRTMTQSVSIQYLYVVNQAGALLNRFIPLESGEVLKGALISRRVPTQSAISGTILYNYLFKLAKPITCMLALGTGLLFGSPEVRHLSLLVLPAAFLSFLPYVGLKLLIRFGLGRIFVKLVHLVGFGKKNPEKLVNGAREVDELVGKFWRDRRSDYLTVLGLQIGGRLFSWASWYLLIYEIDKAYDLPTSSLIWTATIIMGYIVSVLPSRLGTTEAGGWAVFKVLGLDPIIGLTATSLMTLRAVSVNGLSALCLVFFDTRKRRADADGEEAEVITRR